MKKRVLVIDDEPGVRTSLKMALEPTYEVVCAADANEGIELFRRESPHLVLLDLVLPDTDGLTLLPTLHAEDRSVPVIMLTALKTVKTAVDAMKAGAADYLTKPFDVEELRVLVAKTLAAGELERELTHLRAEVAHGTASRT
ncbi:response regulator [Nitrospira sp. Kam-Ns4a]